MQLLHGKPIYTYIVKISNSNSGLRSTSLRSNRGNGQDDDDCQSCYIADIGLQIGSLIWRNNIYTWIQSDEGSYSVQCNGSNVCDLNMVGYTYSRLLIVRVTFSWFCDKRLRARRFCDLLLINPQNIRKLLTVIFIVYIYIILLDNRSNSLKNNVN